MSQVTMEKIVNMCKTQGFVYQGSEIYGGFANLGLWAIRCRIKKQREKSFVEKIYPRVTI